MEGGEGRGDGDWLLSANDMGFLWGGLKML